MAKALWECDTKKRMGLLHEIPPDEGGKVDFAWSEPVSSRSWGMLPRESSLICDPLSGSFPIRKMMAFSGSRRQRLEYLIAMVTPIRWLLLLLSMMLSSQVVAGELSFTGSHLEHMQSFETNDEFQLTLLAPTPEVNIRLNKLQGRIRRHAHPQSNHFLYLIRGQIELTVGDETKVVGAGDFVTIPRETPHAMKRIGDSEALFLDVASPPDVGDVVWYE